MYLIAEPNILTLSTRFKAAKLAIGLLGKKGIELPLFL